jgi:dTDP-4-amino-4,6-dideoxygalactose transaminase
MYVVRTPDRDLIAHALQEAGIGSASYYETPLHLQPAFRGLGYEEGSLPESERAGRENLALPVWPGINAEQQREIVERVRAATTVAAAS